MKKTIKLAVLAWMMSLFAFSSNAQVNVGNGTLVDKGLPIDPYFRYSYSQTIYLASEINASGSITGITFYGVSGISITNSNAWVVYVGHTSKSSFIDGSDWESGLTEVYNGTVSLSGNDVTITFATPFVYNGTDNLIVAVDENTYPYDTNSDDFLCSTVTNNRSLAYRSDSNNPDPLGTLPTAQLVQSVIPNIQFAGITETCPVPSALTATNITPTSADFGWTENGTATTWNVEYGPAGFTPTGVSTILGTTSNPVALSPLTQNTTYDVYIQADCGVDASAWVGPFTFTTACGTFVPTYTEDFASYVPSCWEEADGVLSTSTVLTPGSSSWTSDGFANSGSTGAARMNIFTTGQDEWLISPSIDLTGGPFQLKYDVALTTYSGTSATTLEADDTLAIIISTDNGATWSSANILQVYTAGSEPSNTGDLTIIDLSAYSGVVRFGFYAHSSLDDGADVNVYIDNFVVEPVPACPQVTALTVTNLTSTSVDLGWTENGTATTWNIEYGPAGFTPTGTPTISGTTNNPETINGLLAITGYDFYVQADCGGDVSAWTGPISVTTPCGIYTPTYTQDFASYIPTCWEEADGALAPSTVLTPASSGWTSDGFGNNGFSGSARMNIYTTGQDEWLISPSIDLTGGPFQLKYDVALTPYSGTTATTLEADDTLAIVISTDNGATWSSANILQVYTAGSEPSNNGDLTIIDLSAYSGVVQFGLYAHSSIDDGADVNVYIDNFVVEPIPACQQVSVITATNITGSSLDLGWTENGTATTWNIEYGLAGFTPTGTPTIAGATNNPETINGLLPLSDYEFYVQADCGGDVSIWTGPFSVTTPCGIYTPNYLQDFGSYVPECWEEAEGLLTPSTVVTPGSSSWTSDGFANNGFSGSARMNIYNTGQEEWLISPSIDLTGGPFQLEYDVALTTYAGTAATTMDADDSLAVVISTDNGATWSNANILKAYTAGSEPSNTGQHEYIDLSAYSGVVRFGFYAVSTQNLVVDNDVFIDNFEVTALCLPEYTTDVQTACESLTWIDGNTYTSNNNTATFTLTNTAGCDSIVTLDLTILSTSGTDVITACGPYTWIDGITYTASNNTATFTLTNAALCDSIVTLDLTMAAPNSGTDVITACGPYTWIDGITYVADNNTATFTLTNTAGCDSIVTLDLTMAAPNSGTDVISACESYTWIDGNTYNASNNTATFTLTNTAGCDSIVTLDLTILTPATGTDVIAACESYTWIDGNTYTASNNTATFNVVGGAANGCDSIVTLDLTISTPSTGTDVQTACDSYTWIDGITYTSSNNTATFNIVGGAANGCDSLVTLDLTITSVSNTGVTVSGATLTADLPLGPGVSLNWLDCDNGYATIPGETAQSFSPSSNGNYAVRIVENTCVDTSACFLIDNVGLDKYDLNVVSIVPNPTSDIVKITFEGAEATLTILDINGKLVNELTVQSGDAVDMTLFENGVYLFTLTSDSIRTVERVVKQ